MHTCIFSLSMTMFNLKISEYVRKQQKKVQVFYMQLFQSGKGEGQCFPNFINDSFKCLTVLDRSSLSFRIYFLLLLPMSFLNKSRESSVIPYFDRYSAVSMYYKSFSFLDSLAFLSKYESTFMWSPWTILQIKDKTQDNLIAYTSKHSFCYQFARFYIENLYDFLQ